MVKQEYFAIFNDGCMMKIEADNFQDAIKQFIGLKLSKELISITWIGISKD